MRDPISEIMILPSSRSKCASSTVRFVLAAFWLNSRDGLMTIQGPPLFCDEARLTVNDTAPPQKSGTGFGPRSKVDRPGIGTLVQAGPQRETTSRSERVPVGVRRARDGLEYNR
jgi:hypothetical protein